MKKLICILVSIFLLIPMCVGCAQDGYTDDSTKDVTDTPEVTTEDMTDTPEVTTEDMTDTSGVATEDVTEPDVTEPDVSTQLPSFYNIEDVESFETFDAFVERLCALENENSSQIGEVKLSDMIRDIKGFECLDEEPWIQWNGGLDYSVSYTRYGDNYPWDRLDFWSITFMPFYSVADFESWRAEMSSAVPTSYEALLKHEEVHDVIKMPLETEIGTAYECTYSRNGADGLKLQYFEYTDPSNNMTYMLSRYFETDGTIMDHELYVLNGENPWYIYTDDPNLTISVATKLSSVLVSEEEDDSTEDVTDTSEVIPPDYGYGPVYGGGFEGFDEFINRIHVLENENDPQVQVGDVKLSDMIRDIEGLDHLDASYCDDVLWIEWHGWLSYDVSYQRYGDNYPEDFFDVYATCFHPFYSEADLNREVSYNRNDTYEELLDNDLISNIQKMPLETELGTAYECTYDTRSKIGLKLQYFEYTDPSDTITYTLSRHYNVDGVMYRADLYVYNGENSFYVGTDDPGLTISVATKLSSVPVK